MIRFIKKIEYPCKIRLQMIKCNCDYFKQIQIMHKFNNYEKIFKIDGTQICLN